ncbi:hypothetical protein ACFSM5_04940 [Lacibacterium aquatile]|uniref:Uncharacterized protein n=1 Tax=Lacibacterium aquatile TaxID=1168082 RepID=A0ABW5DP17_9PROT
MRLLFALLIIACRPAIAQESEVAPQPAPDHLATIADTYLSLHHPIVWSPGLRWLLEPPPEPRDTWTLKLEDTTGRGHSGLLVLSARSQAIVAEDIRIVGKPIFYEPEPLYRPPLAFPPTPELLAIAEEEAKKLRHFEKRDREWVTYDGADLIADETPYHRNSTYKAVTAETWVIRQKWTIDALDGHHAMIVIAKSDKRVLKVGYNFFEEAD